MASVQSRGERSELGMVDGEWWMIRMEFNDDDGGKETDGITIDQNHHVRHPGKGAVGDTMYISVEQ